MRYCSCEEPQLIQNPTTMGYYCNECELDIPKERAELLQKPRPRHVPQKVLRPGEVAAYMERARMDIATIKKWLDDYNLMQDWNKFAVHELEHFYNLFGTDQTQWVTKMREQIQTAENYLLQAKRWYDSVMPHGINPRTLPKKKQRQLGFLPPV